MHERFEMGELLDTKASLQVCSLEDNCFTRAWPSSVLEFAIFGIPLSANALSNFTSFSIGLRLNNKLFPEFANKRSVFRVPNATILSRGLCDNGS